LADSNFEIPRGVRDGNSAEKENDITRRESSRKKMTSLDAGSAKKGITSFVSEVRGSDITKKEEGSAVRGMTLQVVVRVTEPAAVLSSIHFD